MWKYADWIGLRTNYLLLFSKIVSNIVILSALIVVLRAKGQAMTFDICQVKKVSSALKFQGIILWTDNKSE